MPAVTITANWETGNLSNRMISRQYDNNRYMVQFAGYPEDGAENLIFYLLVFMKTEKNKPGTMIPPVQLSSDQWTISNYFTQLEQQIQFQLCIQNESGTFEAHSPIFNGVISDSLEHDGTVQDVDVTELFDAYREYINQLVVAAGAIVIDPTLSVQGAAADAKAVGDRIAELEQGGTGGLTADIKAALLSAFSHVAWDSDDPTGQSYISALQTALYPPANLSRITAVYTQPGTVWSTDTLDSLKPNLVVTAYYSDNTSEVVSNYTLSGTLTAGTRTITTSYGGKTATFTVVVTQASKNTSPAIAQSDKRLNNKNVVVDCAGMSLTEYYDITNISKLTIHNYYTEETAPYNVAYACLVDANDTFLKYYNLATATEQSKDWSAETFANPATKIRFSLFTSGLTTAYAYDTDTGNILFAGSASPYYGMDNISEASA